MTVLGCPWCPGFAAEEYFLVIHFEVAHDVSDPQGQVALLASADPTVEGARP